MLCNCVACGVYESVSFCDIFSMFHMDCMISFNCHICFIFCLSIHSGLLGGVLRVVLFHSVLNSSSRESFVASTGVWRAS